jgi:hypothetical protein
VLTHIRLPISEIGDEAASLEFDEGFLVSVPLVGVEVDTPALFQLEAV